MEMETKKMFLTSTYLACEKWGAMKIQIVITRAKRKKKENNWRKDEKIQTQHKKVK